MAFITAEDLVQPTPRASLSSNRGSLNDPDRGIARQRGSTAHEDLPIIDDTVSARHLILKAAGGLKRTMHVLNIALTQIGAPCE